MVVNFVSGDDAAAEVVKQIKSFAVAAYAHQADVSQEGDVQAMFAHMCAQFGTIGESAFTESLNRSPIPMSSKTYRLDFTKTPAQPGQEQIL